MSRLGALLVLTAGAALGTYCYLVPPSDGETDLAEITRISAAPDRDHRREQSVQTFSAASPVFRDVIPEAASGTVAPSSPKVGTWTTVVSPGQSIVTPVRSSSLGDPETRAGLASDLQRELKRVGCYGGEITGTWNMATRRAMAAFVDRANATLPINDPDYVLLALVQSHREITCTGECPAGQVIADGGRCLPRAVVAQASKKSKRLEERRLAASRLAGDRQGVVATAEPEKLPWLTNATPTDAVVVESRELPPGRMSIGGPAVEMSVPPPPEALPSPTPEQRQVLRTATPIDPSATSNLDGQSTANPAQVAAVRSETGINDLAIDPDQAASGVAVPADGVDSSAAKAKPTPHAEDRARRNHYAGGRTRRGDPRPGTMRYNIVQALGGIY